MKTINYLLIVLAGLLLITSCDKTETYAEKLERERNAINSYIVKEKIKVISEKQFKDQGYTTNLDKNEYVLLNNTGVYLQIVNKGSGSPIKNGEQVSVLCRFAETNILENAMILTNKNLYYSGIVDKMVVDNISGTFTASFDMTSSVMYNTYKSTSVPKGWLVPLTYINIGRPKDENEHIAKVRLIVPSSQGTTKASQNVIPCYYEITYMRGLN